MKSKVMPRKPYLSYKQEVINISEHEHQYCLKCQKVMLYHKDNGICLSCDTGM